MDRGGGEEVLVITCVVRELWDFLLVKNVTTICNSLCRISEEDKLQTEKQVESLQEAYDKLCERSCEELQHSQSMLAEASGEKVRTNPRSGEGFS